MTKKEIDLISEHTPVEPAELDDVVMMLMDVVVACETETPGQIMERIKEIQDKLQALL